MTAIAIQRETKAYWEKVQGASDQVKVALISLLSASLAKNNTKATVADEASKPTIGREDLELTPFVASLGKGLSPLPADFDYEKAREDYLMQKYR